MFKYLAVNMGVEKTEPYLALELLHESTQFKEEEMPIELGRTT